MMRRLFLTAAVVAAVVGLPPPRADAAFLVSLSQTGATDKTFNLDNQAEVSQYFNVFSSANGDKTYILRDSVSVGDYFVSGSFVVTNHPGTLSGAKLNIGEAFVYRSSLNYGDLLTIQVTQTDFTLPTGPGAMVGLTGSGNFGSGANPIASATLTSTVDLGNNAFGLNTDSSQVHSTSIVLGTIGSGTGVEGFSNPFDITGSYSITTAMTLSGLGVGQYATGLNANTVVHAPAPAGLALAAGAVPFLGLIRRRFRAAPTTAA